MKRIYLIDCPGVVPPSNNDSPEDILLRGVVRVENVENPEQYIAAVLKKTKPHHIERTYDIRGFVTPTEFLELLARKGGRLLKGGEADVDGAAKMVLNDFLRGKLPWFTAPPVPEGGKEEKGIEGRQGALGEMGRIGRSEVENSIAGTVDINMEGDEDDEDEDDDEAFKGFEEDKEDEEEQDDEDEDESMQSSVEEEPHGIEESISMGGGVALEAG
ncbi:hypothetical protein P7C71_g4423, partial [Lecanoromycetidae sp. Uapishka_2]